MCACWHKSKWHEWICRPQEKKGKWYHNSHPSGTDFIIFPPKCFLRLSFLAFFWWHITRTCIPCSQGKLFLCVCMNSKEYQEKLFLCVWTQRNTICKVLIATLYTKVLTDQILQSWEMQAHIEVHKKKNMVNH